MSCDTSPSHYPPSNLLPVTLAIVLQTEKVALHFALENNHPACAKALLDHGANTEVKDKASDERGGGDG